MRYTAVIMVPRIIQFDAEGPPENVTNQAWAICNNFDSVILPDTTFEPRLLVVVPEKEDEDPPLVFDPPPFAA